MWVAWAVQCREIGHGRLACRSVQAMLPAADVFPYTIRGGVGNHRVQRFQLHGFRLRSLALMYSGVLMKASAAGIAMGLSAKARSSPS